MRGISISSCRDLTSTPALFMYLYLHVQGPQGASEVKSEPHQNKNQRVMSSSLQVVLSRCDKTAGPKLPLQHFLATQRCLCTLGFVAQNCSDNTWSKHSEWRYMMQTLSARPNILQGSHMTLDIDVKGSIREWCSQPFVKLLKWNICQWCWNNKHNIGISFYFNMVVCVFYGLICMDS